MKKILDFQVDESEIRTKNAIKGRKSRPLRTGLQTLFFGEARSRLGDSNPVSDGNCLIFPWGLLRETGVSDRGYKRENVLFQVILLL